MSEIILDVKNVSKSFRLHENKKDSLKETLSSVFSAGASSPELFHALTDISFSLEQGEVLGIIGKNGAGKSTLLKILSGVTFPDEGEINFYGKSVSVLDVGAGFHPELTGRENVYLSATLYGLSKKEIEAKFESIVDFSGVRAFIDEPVKAYSSGMYLRLAFSVVIALDADILMFDEVLYFGDDEFRFKSKRSITELCGNGKTIILANHDYDFLMKVCDRIILLNEGKIENTFNLKTEREKLNDYLSDRLDVIQQTHAKPVPSVYQADEVMKWENISIKGITINSIPSEEVTIYSDNETVIEVEYELHNTDVRCDFSLMFTDEKSDIILSVSTIDPRKIDFAKHAGSNTIRYVIPNNYFNSGTLLLTLIVIKDMNELVVRYKNVKKISIERLNSSANNLMGMQRVGLLYADFDWKHN